MTQLAPLPDQVPYRILVGGCVRKPPALLQAHLDTLTAQILPPQVALTPAFIDDNTDPASSELLLQYVAAHQGVLIPGLRTDTGDFSDAHAVTHQWSGDAMQRVGAMKNQLIQFALQEHYDALWLLDSDLLLSPRVLWSLWHTEAPIACAVFWTRWQDTPGTPPLPQVWLRHPYQLDGRGMEAPDFLHQLVERGRVQVWGQGACTLYRREPLEKGLTFDRLPDLPTVGMWQGEDRHLCTRAERMHIPMFADAWPDLWHCYHPREQQELAHWQDLLAAEETRPVQTDDLVSLHLHALEPLEQNGQWVRINPQYVRGRLGRIAVADEIEQAIRTMQRGDAQIVSVLYPPWSPSPFKGQRRLIRVTLVDYKPYRLPIGL